MKAYKLEIVCFDPNGDCDFDGMLYEIEKLKYFSKHIISAQSAECGKWYDDHPLNQHDGFVDFIEHANWTPEPM
jgi:hypothetical protein